MARTFMPDWVELKRVHENCLNAGIPVLDWETFSNAVADLLVEHESYQSVRDRVYAAQEAAVPNTHTDRYVGFLAYEQPHVVELFEIDSDTYTTGGVADLTKSDLQFKLLHGKARRNPLAAMKKRAAEFRKAAMALEEGLRRYEDREVAASWQARG